MSNKNLTLFAKIISAVFSPPILLTLLLLKPSFFSEQQTVNNLGIIIFIFVGLLPCFISFIYLKNLGKISDWNVSKLKQRHLINRIIIADILLMLFVTQIFGVRILWYKLLFFLLWYGIYSLITLYWKISLHTASVTLFFFSNSDNEKSLALLFVIGLVTWSRIYLKQHTIMQAIAGIILGTVSFFILIAFSYFALLEGA